MALDTAGILNKMVTHIKTTGRIKNVVKHDPLSNVPFGTVSVIIRRIFPTPETSSLRKTGVAIVFSIAIYANDMAEPRDGAETELLNIFDSIMALFNRDFKLGGAIHSIDFFGRSGVSVDANMGRIEIDKKLYRVLDITLPVLIFDTWTQGE